MRQDLDSEDNYPLEKIRYLWERQENGKFLYANFASVRNCGTMPYKKVQTIRPELGDFPHVYFYSLYEFSLLYLAPSLASDFYKIGKILGYYTAYAGLKASKLEKVVDALRKTKLSWELFSRIADAQTHGWRGIHHGIVDKIDANGVKKTITYWIRYTPELSASKSTNPTCFVSLGAICGHCESVFGSFFDGTETHCMSKGDSQCIFEVHSHENEEEPTLTLPTRTEENILLDTLITKITKKEAVNRGELSESSYFLGSQADSYLINSISPGHVVLSKHAGRICGERIAEKAQLQGQDAALTYLEDMFLYLKAGILHSEKAGDRVIIKMKESVYASGVSNIHQNLCIFLAGIIEGALNKATGQKWDVSEMKCLASGFPECEFWCKKI